MSYSFSLVPRALSMKAREENPSRRVAPIIRLHSPEALTRAWWRQGRYRCSYLRTHAVIRTMFLSAHMVEVVESMSRSLRVELIVFRHPTLVN